MSKWTRSLRFALPAAGCLFLGTGCQPDAVFPLKSTEGQTLNRMLDEGRTVGTDVQDGLSVRFDPVAIDRLDDWFFGNWISARLTWTWTVEGNARSEGLRGLAKEPLPADATPDGVWVRLEYLDANGQKLAENSIFLSVKENGGRTKLMNFGRGGEPVRIRAVVERVSVAAPVPAIPPAAEEPVPKPAPDAAK